MTKKLNILIAEAHSLILAGIVKTVEQTLMFKEISIANNGQEAFDILSKKNIDVLITDIEIGILDGIALTQLVKKKYPHTKIIIVTQHDENWIIWKLIKLGADAIIINSKTDSEELALALRNVAVGKKNYSPSIEHLFFKLKISENKIPKLTIREKEVLKLICNENIIKQIAQKLDISISTVESHRKNLFKKLKVKSQSGLVREAIRYGFYVFD